MTNGPWIGKISLTAESYASGIDLGTFKIEDPKNEAVDSMGMPDTKAEEQEHFTQGGAEKEWTITGQYGPTGATWAQVIAWKEALEALLSGSQADDSAPRWLALYKPGYFPSGNPLWYSRDNLSLAQDSASNGPVHVIISDFNPGTIEGSSPELSYTLKLTQQVKY